MKKIKTISTDMNKDTFVPIGDELINSIFIIVLETIKMKKAQMIGIIMIKSFYEQCKRKYKYTTEDKKK